MHSISVGPHGPPGIQWAGNSLDVWETVSSLVLSRESRDFVLIVMSRGGGIFRELIFVVFVVLITIGLEAASCECFGILTTVGVLGTGADSAIKKNRERRADRVRRGMLKMLMARLLTRKVLSAYS